MPSAETGTAVEREVRVAAAAETVFDFFADPDKMVQWMGRSAQLEPRAGGTFRVDLNGRDVARGEYVTVDRPDRVVFTWGWEADDALTAPGSSTVEVTLRPDGDGTVVRLRHTDLPEEARGAHAHGWEHYMERLGVAAAGGDPGADPWQTPEGADAGN